MEACRFLRPASYRHVASKPCSAYARFFVAARSLRQGSNQAEGLNAKAGRTQKLNDSVSAEDDATKGLNDYEKRIAALESRSGLDKSWPRLRPDGKLASRTPEARRATIREIAARADELSPGETETSSLLAVYGRVKKVRKAGKRLAFIDLQQDGHILQVICDFGKIGTAQGDHDATTSSISLIRAGDWLSAVGFAHKAERGALSLFASEKPIIQSPSLHQISQSRNLEDIDPLKPHVRMLSHPGEIQTLRLRARLESAINQWLEKNEFLRVNTPIVAAGAGGATARSFRTDCVELQSTELNLRIAPELWLKRLVVAGMGKVFEMGPAFRNEGVDATHNPEFTMCEFYWPFASLEQLMTATEDMFRAIFDQLSNLDASWTSHLPESIVHRPNDESHPPRFFPSTFPRLPFIPTLEREMKQTLPRLDQPSTRRELLQLFQFLPVPIPSRQTTPSLLEALCAHYIEPLCTTPTFITEHPAPLSPLAKSFTCPITNQVVSARAELFINGMEYANMYEEENSPFEQRRKLEMQHRYRLEAGEGERMDEDVPKVDEGYIEALEWGLPPTGGWGLGVDRLAMLFTGRKRIGQVLPFGTLRNVVGIGKLGRR